MLSYQHAYHAGNLADVHKHALLAVALARMVEKPKPLSYLETHAGRGLYDLGAPEARRTGEAAAGITRALAEGWLPEGHPLRTALQAVRAAHGPNAYPGSPLLAGALLRPGDRAHLAELHPAEFAALAAVAGFADLRHEDGFAMANAALPPTPRRGLLLIDPSYEVKADYDRLPGWIGRMAGKWNVGVIALWYPVLAPSVAIAPAQAAMVRALTAAHPEALLSEVRFPPAREGHGMIGSGMFVLNPPWGLEGEAQRLQRLFATL